MPARGVSRVATRTHALQPSAAQTLGSRARAFVARAQLRACSALFGAPDSAQGRLVPHPGYCYAGAGRCRGPSGTRVRCPCAATAAWRAARPDRNASPATGAKLLERSVRRRCRVLRRRPVSTSLMHMCGRVTSHRTIPLLVVWRAVSCKQLCVILIRGFSQVLPLRRWHLPRRCWSNRSAARRPHWSCGGRRPLRAS